MVKFISRSNICLMCYKLRIINSGVSSRWQSGTGGWSILLLYFMIILVASTKQIIFHKCVEGTECFRNSVLLKQLSCLFKQVGRVLRDRLFVVWCIKTKEYETCSKVQCMHIYWNHEYATFLKELSLVTVDHNEAWWGQVW
jgi:hypothetical protein